MRKYLDFFFPHLSWKKNTPKRCRLHDFMCWWILFVHFQGIAMGLVSLLVTPTRFIPPKQWNSLREYSRDGWVVTRWTLRWVFRDRGPLLMETTWGSKHAQKRPSSNVRNSGTHWTFFRKGDRATRKSSVRKLENLFFQFFQEQMIPGSSLHFHGFCFFGRCLVRRSCTGDSKFYPELSTRTKNHPILPAENATWHRHLNGRAGWFLYDSYRGQKGLEGGSCDLSSHQNGSPVFFLGWIKDSRCRGHFENVDAKTCVLGALFHIFFSMVKMSRVISFCGALSI